MEKIWLQSYQSGVPAEIDPDKYSSLVEFFEKNCERYGSKVAFSNFGSTLTYKKIERLTEQFAAYLQQELGLKKGDRFAIMMPNCLQYPVAIFAALRAGLIVTNINPLYTPEELVRQINDAECDTLLVLDKFANTVEKALPEMHLKNILITELGDLFGFFKSHLFNFVIKHIKKLVPEYSLPNTISFRHALNKGKHLTLKPVDIQREDIACLQYTGGTTGVAKGAELTHRNLLANLAQADAWLQAATKPGEEIVVTALPLYHIFALTANCLTFFQLGAHNVLITNPRDFNQFIQQIATVKFTCISGVNTLFNALLHHSKFKTIDFSQLCISLGGGMAVQEAVAKEWHERTGCVLLEAYGLTETSPAVTINPMDLEIYNSSIGLPISSTEVSIRNPEGEEVPIGEPGELCVKGPQVMRGYWRKPDETKKVLSKDGWLKTGDVAVINEKGFLKIVDRIKDMILVSGFNVYPNEIEDALVAHPGVIEAGVVGVPNAMSGEVVKAFIVKKDKNLKKLDIIAHCKKTLTSYKIPKEIVFVDELPKSNVGKILRKELREINGRKPIDERSNI